MKMPKNSSKLMQSISSLEPEKQDGKYQEKNRNSFNQLREHEFMLVDMPRINSYHDVISRKIKPGDLVIDLGTGTGILAFFAAQQNASRVYAIEHADIINLARKVADFNHFDNIEFLQIHSKDFVLNRKVDVIIQEQMGNFLFDEYMVENVCDLRDRYLKQDGKIIPSRFEFFIEPVKMDDSHYVPFLKEINIHGIDFSCVNEQGSEVFYSYLWRNDPKSVEFFLCRPESIYTFDLTSIKAEELPKEFSYTREVQNSGRMDGFIVYFRCLLDDDISFTTGPFEERATSWKYWLLRTESKYFNKGDFIHFHLRSEDLQKPLSWQWDLLEK